MESLILIVHVLLAISVIALVLLQQGKGADMGASFGSGASQTVFGSGGSGNFMTRATAVLATFFFVTSFALAIVAKDKAVIDANEGFPALVTEQSIDVDALPEMVDEAVLREELPVDASLPDLD
ncbi:MAG: preprotein translocase subunit SecG [Pseudomonadales bacterium]